MSRQTRVSHPLNNLLPTEIERFDSLAELAQVGRQLSPDLWEITHNPWVLLQTVS